MALVTTTARLGAKKKRKPVPVRPKPPTITPLAAQGYDPKFWRRSMVWFKVGWDKKLSQEQYDACVARGLDVSGAKATCYCCGVGYAAETQTLPCICSQHIPCGSWVNTTNPGYQFGPCKRPDHCRYCCHCLICKKCGRNCTSDRKPKVMTDKYDSKNWDANCGLCINCCQCLTCVNCGKKMAKKCPDASKKVPHHADCCDSDERIAANAHSLLFIHRGPIFHEGTNFQFVRSRRFLSVESEVTNFRDGADLRPLNLFARNWGAGVVHDGTVPNGAEICTAPASGDKFEAQMRDLARLHAGAGAETTVRTGMHVHVDARDFYYADLVNLIHLYAKIEPALFAMLPPWRRINRFCTPCRSTLLSIANKGDKLTEAMRDPEILQFAKVPSASLSVRKPSIALALAAKLYKAKTLRVPKKIHKSHDNQHIRYMALNLHSWVFRRTIEFRHFHGSTNEEDLLLWPQIMACILDTAKRLPITAKRGRPSIMTLPHDPVEALLEMLKPKSWVSQDLLGYAQRALKTWSPDWKIIWPIMEKQQDAVVPFHKISPVDNLSLSYDITSKAYTYLGSRYMTWDFQWNNPLIAGGRFADTPDLIAVPQAGDIAWVRKKNVEEPKLKQPETPDAQTMQYYVTTQAFVQTPQPPPAPTGMITFQGVRVTNEEYRILLRMNEEDQNRAIAQRRQVEAVWAERGVHGVGTPVITGQTRTNAGQLFRT